MALEVPLIARALGCVLAQQRGTAVHPAARHAEGFAGVTHRADDGMVDRLKEAPRLELGRVQQVFGRGHIAEGQPHRLRRVIGLDPADTSEPLLDRLGDELLLGDPPLWRRQLRCVEIGPTDQFRNGRPRCRIGMEADESILCRVHFEGKVRIVTTAEPGHCAVAVGPAGPHLQEICGGVDRSDLDGRPTAVTPSREEGDRNRDGRGLAVGDARDLPARLERLPVGLTSACSETAQGGDDQFSGDGLTFMRRHWIMALWPGVAITLIVFAFNVLGDASRDVLDPRLRGS